MNLNSYAHLPANWPEPIVLTHTAGDVFLTLRAENGFLEAKWTGHISAADVIKAAQVSIPILQAMHYQGLLNDKSEVSGEWYEANDWLQYEWMPKAVKAGLKYLAYVYSSNMLSLYSFRDFRSRIPPELQLRTFHTRTAAKVWLDKKSALIAP
ncbi:hypothetical protein [Botryobacter ruber]|uniref:hypothetical protein n=1 Tax=Botryobacter ruber TaxID=2171629 RepID=UPI001F0CD8FF|nr:hypothetical protein [Botryobacter ruber]